LARTSPARTNLLHALHTLNPALGDRSLDDQQYPRWLEKRHKMSGEFATARPIRAVFVLDDDEIAVIEGLFGAGFLATNEWTCSMDYSQRRLLRVEVNEEAACRAVEEAFGVHPGATTVGTLRGQLEGLADQTEPDDEGTGKPTGTAEAASGALASR